MPVNVTYPGVYIDEVRSSVRTITGVPTSVAAFVGYAPRGPADRPVHLTGWADYEAFFGGLQPDCPLSYAVYQFYQNGGSEAEVVRVVGPHVETLTLPLGVSSSSGRDNARSSPAAPTPKDDAASPDTDGEDTSGQEKQNPPGGGRKATGSAGEGAGSVLTLRAASPGRWARHLRARVDHETSEEPGPHERRTLFNLTVRDMRTGAEERYLNVSIEPDSPRNLAHLLESSQLVRASEARVMEVPPANPTPEDGDPFADRAQGSPPGGIPPYYAPSAAPDEGAGKYDERPRDTSAYTDGRADKQGLYQLLKTDIFNVLCLPDLHWLSDLVPVKPLVTDALNLCVERRAVLLVDPPASWTGKPTGGSPAGVVGTLLDRLADVELGEAGRNAAVYYPRVLAPDPLRSGAVRAFPPSGVMAGILARTDVQRGVWKAPAGTDASLSGVTDLEVALTDREIGRLNPVGVNCLRRLPAAGPVAWGARTLRGADRLADEWKYLPVRRLALFIEESLFRGTQWVVFEPNDEPLWASIRLNVGAFMNSLFRAGAFQGRTPQEAYLVKCDKDTNPQNDIDRGIVNVQVGFAPLKPAEFVIVHIQQLAGQIQV
ncbi:phage tail sheath C-terminal domain-containing protein [Streptomyces sp. bgisy154]|uniref:phage tail sheath family protein n=1 Tax=Streptomyces sp. bgisy154 TaxID=3413794 RepID=UPI003D7491D2